MICPRCDSPAGELLVSAPVDDAWEVFACTVCAYTWRSTEPAEVTDPARYDPRFRIDPATIDGLTQMPPIPPLRR